MQAFGNKKRQFATQTRHSFRCWNCGWNFFRRARFGFAWNKNCFRIIPHQRPIHRCAKVINIRSLDNRFFRGLFWRHVSRRALKSRLDCSNLARLTQVDDLRDLLGIPSNRHHDVARLHIRMDKSFFMHVRKTFRDLSKDADIITKQLRRIFFERRRIDHLKNKPNFHHFQERSSALQSNHFSDCGMIQFAQSCVLRFNLLQITIVLISDFVNDNMLECVRRASLTIFHRIEFAACALSKKGHNFVSKQIIKSDFRTHWETFAL